MVSQHVAVLIFLFVAAISTMFSTSQAWAETPVGSNVDTRFVVALRVAEAELQKWLPAPWQLSPPATGPSKDANLNVIFVDRLLNLDADGKPAGGGTYRVVALSVPAKNPQTGESAPFSIRIFAGDPQALPGPYKTSVLATVKREQTLSGANLEPGVGEEAWEARDAAGGMIALRVRYQRAVPSRVKVEARPHSAIEPSFFRIYRVDQGVDVLKSVPTGVDRVQAYSLRVTVAELGKLFDGSEQLVSLSAVPFYLRQTSLP